MPAEKSITSISKKEFVALSREFKKAASLGFTKRAKIILMSLLRLPHTIKTGIPKHILDTYQEIEKKNNENGGTNPKT